MRRLLIVDDNNMNCIMAKKALQDKYETFICNSGKEALNFLENESVDLILMDIEMPEMNGREVVGKIKENPVLAKIPIIFLTADSDPKTEVECLSLGADDFITKPFVPLVMNTRVSRILEVHELRKDLEHQLEKKTIQMEKATLKSLTDALTGLYNRDYLQQTLTKFLDNGGIGTLFMIDLDNFKAINDTYGHIVGDKTLQNFSDVLKECSRGDDIVCRLAGDEFVTFYPNLVDRKTAAKRAEEIITKFAEKMGALGYGGIVSVSIGIMTTTEPENFKELYNKADKALYYVKNNGKNAYHFYDDNNTAIKEINTAADLEYVSSIMKEGLSEQKGAFNVAYDEFKKIYDFVSRYVSRGNQNVQIVLFTMRLTTKESAFSIEEIMDLWNDTATASLRSADTGTRYSNSQYMMIFMDVDYDNGNMVAKRVIDKFFDMNKNLIGEVNIIYDIRTLDSEN
ncbi:MAG: diguanylate cyclase [Lachnospiraceae bacterium]|nr:diguanylate cyclase [Lachnospiraceae bacterium]